MPYWEDLGNGQLLQYNDDNTTKIIDTAFNIEGEIVKAYPTYQQDKGYYATIVKTGKPATGQENTLKINESLIDTSLDNEELIKNIDKKLALPTNSNVQPGVSVVSGSSPIDMKMILIVAAVFLVFMFFKGS